MNDVNSLTSFLILVKNKELSPDFEGPELRQYGPVLITYEEFNNYAKLALDLEFARGYEIIDAFQEQVPALYVSSPILAPKGEKYLRDQKIFVKYPILEKVMLVIISGIVSAITTLAINYFTN